MVPPDRPDDSDSYIEALLERHGDDFVGYDAATNTVTLRERAPATAAIEVTCPELTAIDLLEHLGRSLCWRLVTELRCLLESDSA